jgi:lipoprotein-anchoring transpeptidase ErfK/SrfK
MTRFACTALAALSLACAVAPAHANLDQPVMPFPFILAPLLAPLAAAPQYHQPPQYPVAPRIQYEDEEAQPQRPSEPTRQIVSFTGSQAPGTIIVNTTKRKLYYVLPGGRAVQYSVGVGREGFQWAGTQTITNKQEWPDWRPPEEMIKRRPDLPRYMAGGPHNPLGARALYLGGTLYRIHGSNEPETIGQAVSSGCIRMLNEDVVDLYNRVKVGTQVVVLR